MLLTFNKWVRLALFNLLIVALCGVLLRYKIIYSLYFISQKHLLHAHSHFAFAGWVSQMLMIFFVYYLDKHEKTTQLKKYEWLLAANFVSSYGMLIAFTIQGYALYSILFSTISTVVAILFSIFCWRDMRSPGITTLCFKTALLFNVISAAGTIALGILMSGKIANQDLYLSSIYFYLHFQYNGWFFFGCMGVLFVLLPVGTYSQSNVLKAFRLLAAACVPAYLLSIIIFKIPSYIYMLAVIAALTQLTGIILLLRSIRPALKKADAHTRAFAVIIATAVIIKFCLQGMSTIPVLGTLAFGFRPVVVGYLHLVLLAIISFFLVVSLRSVFQPSRLFNAGLIFFITAIVLNELLLALQGFLAYIGIIMPFIQELLLLAAILLFTATLILNVGFKQRTGNRLS